MLRYDFDQSLIYWTCTTAHAMERALNDELAPHGITYRQWQVLAWLVLEGQLSQNQLAERMRIEAPTLAGILDRMQRDGWLVREACPTDRRKKLLRLTEKVEPIWSKIAEAGQRVRARAAQGFPPMEVDRLIEILRQIQRNLKGSTEEAEGNSHVSVSAKQGK